MYWSLHEIIERYIQWNMLKSRGWLILIACFVALSISSCKRGSKLKRTIETELESGVRNDSLFLGLKFGITLQEFYDHCWELNRDGTVKEGPNNMSVEYIFKDSLDNPIAFNFYAGQTSNRNEKVYQYNTSFYYYAWALNRHLYSDKLIKMLVPILMEWYGGNEPFAQTINGEKHIFKIDGNRMIDIYIFDESKVSVTFTDLSHNPYIVTE